MEPEPCLWLLCSGAAVVGACPAPSRSSSGLGRSEDTSPGTELHLGSYRHQGCHGAQSPYPYTHTGLTVCGSVRPQRPQPLGHMSYARVTRPPNGWSRLGEALKLVDRTFCGARRVQCPPPAPPWRLTPTQDLPCLSEPGPCAMPGLTRPRGPHSACTGGWRLAGPRCAQV